MNMLLQLMDFLNERNVNLEFSDQSFNPNDRGECVIPMGHFTR